MNINSIGGLTQTPSSLLNRQVDKAEAPAETDFAAMLGNGIAAMAEQLRNAETVSIAGVKGAAPTQAVVEQVMAAEQTLQASIAIRDKIVAAYLEISRMAI